VGQLVAGLALGFPAAIAAGRLLRAQLFGVSPQDPLVLGGALLLSACAVVAAWIPGRRAATIDPVTALRVNP
jgi:ABC-type antimicrobial peptide transport system permease subunit